MLAALLSNTVIQEMRRSHMESRSRQAIVACAGYGAFAGYNWQWEDVVLGLEANYLHGSFGGHVHGVQGAQQRRRRYPTAFSMMSR